MLNYKLLAICCCCPAQFVSDLVGNQNCWFCHEAALIMSRCSEVPALLGMYVFIHSHFRLEHQLCNMRNEHRYCRFIFFYSVLHHFQDYFSSYEMGQSVGGTRTPPPPRKTTRHTHKQNSVNVSPVRCAGCTTTPDTAVR